MIYMNILEECFQNLMLKNLLMMTLKVLKKKSNGENIVKNIKKTEALEIIIMEPFLDSMQHKITPKKIQQLYPESNFMLLKLLETEKDITKKLENKNK